MPDPAQQLPPYAALVRHPVADFDSWKAGFDAHEDARRGAGIVGHHLNRDENDLNMVTVFVAIADLEKAKAFTSSDELKSIMQDVGVTGAPEFTWMTPERENAVWDRELPAFLLSHHVADFDAWLEGYDGADALRRSKGIVGQAANRSMDDRSLAIVYHQAESFDALRDFLADGELKVVMKEAGVTSEPEVTFHIGGWGKLYE